MIITDIKNIIIKILMEIFLIKNLYKNNTIIIKIKLIGDCVKTIEIIINGNNIFFKIIFKHLLENNLYFVKYNSIAIGILHIKNHA